MKAYILFVFLFIVSITFSQKVDRNGIVYTNPKSLFNELNGQWKVVSMSVENFEVDCEKFEESFLNQLKKNKIDSLSLREKLKLSCRNMNKQIISISKESMVQGRDTLHVKRDNNLKRNTLITKTENKEFELKIEIIDDNYFKLISAKKMWLKLKIIND
ncbi:hypothetical protein H3Z83_00180 [Tenacibaculum sp. S7007]|uniref:Lipocalin-like domain-containing protein n=1 Tax=Tenacibaculum pelagium TaxID=2759527 RepID=A0A839AKN3_9FLAO|nr:hypothetical protein [Tenacibaculum pelagium]MBA6154940.1 hypothetical protein [Tenacibaculum pelagium]